MTATIPVNARTETAPRLTVHELEVITAWYRHRSKAEAAAALYLSENTVRTHISRIRAKYAYVGTDVSTKARLLRQLRTDGLL